MKSSVWETAVMIASFVLLWAWFVAYQTSLKTNVPQPLWWYALLLLSVAALVVVMVRRIRRLQQALRGEDENGQPMPTFPMFGAPPQGSNGQQKKK